LRPVQLNHSDRQLKTHSLSLSLFDSCISVVLLKFVDSVLRLSTVVPLINRLGFRKEEADKRILELIKASPVDATLDLEKNLLIVRKHYPNAYQQVLDRTRGIGFRTAQLHNLGRA